MATKKLPDPHGDEIDEFEKEAILDIAPDYEDIPVSNEEQPSLEEALSHINKLNEEVARRRGLPTPEAVTAPPQTVEEFARSTPPSGSAEAAIIDELRAELAAMRAEIRGARRREDAREKSKTKSPSGYPWQYYRLPEQWDEKGLQSGWIVAAPGGAGPSGKRAVSDLAHYISKGAKPLDGYGPAPVPSDGRKLGLYGGIFVPLLEAGGAKEFPLSQIIAYNWHKKPPIRGIEFPQLKEGAHLIREFECPDCGWTSSCLVDDTETQGAYFRHLRVTRDDGRHGYPRNEAAIILESQGLHSPAKYAIEAKERELKELEYVKVESDK